MQKSTKGSETLVSFCLEGSRPYVGTVGTMVTVGVTRSVQITIRRSAVVGQQEKERTGEIKEMGSNQVVLTRRLFKAARQEKPRTLPPRRLTNQQP